MKNDENKLSQEQISLLFTDIDSTLIVDENFKKQNEGVTVSGDVRLSNGMYYTDKEKERYIKQSLKKKLPNEKDTKKKDREM